jgi:predicted transport protein
VAANVLESYLPKAERSADYELSDHAHLVDGAPMRPLFEAFRKEVMALDPCVNEEVLKYYIAYKAETNFVDIVPQKGRLRLTLNLTYHELHDPRKLARDMSNIGRWGNGEVQVGLNSFDELPYILGLVRQAFEKQMGNGDSGP